MRFKGSAKDGNTTTYMPVSPAHQRWRPGWQFLPWKGLGALLLSLGGVVFSIIILVVSNGDEVAQVSEICV